MIAIAVAAAAAAVAVLIPVVLAAAQVVKQVLIQICERIVQVKRSEKLRNIEYGCMNCLLIY